MHPHPTQRLEFGLSMAWLLALSLIQSLHITIGTVFRCGCLRRHCIREEIEAISVNSRLDIPKLRLGVIIKLDVKLVTGAEAGWFKISE